VKRAIEPDLPLEDMIEKWNNIASSLAENKRRRISQLSEDYLRHN